MKNSGKKLLIINILDILKKFSDADHRLSQKDIVELLEKEYNMKADRKSIKRNLMELIDFGFDINFTEVPRTIVSKDGAKEESYILTDFYLEREFTDSELRLLIDSVFFSKHIPKSQCKKLVEKLSGLSNRYFQSRVRYIQMQPDRDPGNPQLFYTIDILDEAIAKKKKVHFHYLHFQTDGKRHKKKNEDGSVKEYTVSPFQIAAANGRYYLISHSDTRNAVSNFRLDRISDIRLSQEKAKKPEEVEELKNGLDLPKMMAEHVYMFAGKSVPVSFLAKKYVLDDLIDWFGSSIRFDKESEEDVICHVTVNENAMRRWALQYSLHVTVLSPKSLADQVREDLKAALNNYQKAE